MVSRIEKGFMMGLGLFALGTDKARSSGEDLEKRGGAKGLADRLAQRGEQERSELKKKTTARMSRVLSDMGFATRADIEDLNRKVGGLAQKAKAS